MKTLIFKLLLLFILLNVHSTLYAQIMENKDTGYEQPVLETETRRYCMTLELKDDPKLITEYETWHQAKNIWKEIPAGIRQVGVIDSEIYRFGTTLFMILTVPTDFNFEEQMTTLADLPRQAEWEDLMTKYQATKPGASSAEKWQKMERIFKLPEYNEQSDR
ncbi:L-rhamnose mutarotase [Bacteroidota bacterium]